MMSWHELQPTVPDWETEAVVCIQHHQVMHTPGAQSIPTKSFSTKSIVKGGGRLGMTPRHQ
jgi:hypothetical protein